MEEESQQNEKSKQISDTSGTPLQLRESLFAALSDLKKTGYDATQLGRAANVSDPTISFLRTGTRGVRLATFQRLLDALPHPAALIFIHHLSNGLSEKDTEIKPRQAIAALLPNCDDDGLKDLVTELKQLMIERRLQGHCEISAFWIISQVMDLLEPKDLPALLNRISKYVEKDIPRQKADKDN